MIPRSGVAAAAAVLALLLGACGADAESPADEPSAGSSASPAPSESSASPSETASTPEVAPATGPVIKVEGMRVNIPEGWRALVRLPVSQSAYETGKFKTVMNVYRFPLGDFTIDQQARADVKQMGPRARRLDDVEIDGTLCYHVVDQPERGVHVERFGTMLGIFQVFWEVRFSNGEDRAERDEVIQSVLATARIG